MKSRMINTKGTGNSVDYHHPKDASTKLNTQTKVTLLLVLYETISTVKSPCV